MKRIFIISILLFASSMAVLYFVLPQVEIQENAKKSFLQKEQDVKTRQEYFNGLKRTFLEISAYQETVDKVSVSMPGEVSLSTILGFFNEKASNNGLILKSVAPFEAVVNDNLAKPEQISFQSFSISLGGSISSFESFLKDIATSQRLIDIESFSLQQEKNDDTSLSITVQLRVFY